MRGVFASHKPVIASSDNGPSFYAKLSGGSSAASIIAHFQPDVIIFTQ